MVEDGRLYSHRGVSFILLPFFLLWFSGLYQVSEEIVLSDPTGLHLGAGPYMLVYSQYLSEEEMNRPLIWPKVFRVGCFPAYIGICN